MTVALDTPRFRSYGRNQIDSLAQLRHLGVEQTLALKAVSAVLPFKVNKYALDELIDWDRIPADPMYQLLFPQARMLDHHDFVRLQDLIAAGTSKEEVARCAREIQERMNPHPAGQMDLNVPTLDGIPMGGFQHKYRETVLFFPRQGQTCHAYCTYCFRWAQFVGIEKFRFANDQEDLLIRYLKRRPEVSDVLFTGGDPLIMSTKLLRRYIEPLIAPDPELEHLSSIRLGTKSPAYWPYRFTTDRDADDLLRLFEEVVASGRQLALMVHFSHYREVEAPAAQEALSRIRSTGAVVRAQAPLIRHVNDNPQVWARMWKSQVRAGVVPYYMFVERDTGPKKYFEVPLNRALRIFTEAYSQVSGLARTVRGPSLSATPGKVLVEGVANINGEKVFVLKFIQARETDWINKVFFAEYDPEATWLDDLKPAFGATEFFFAPYLRAMSGPQRWKPEWMYTAEARDEPDGSIERAEGA